MALLNLTLEIERLISSLAMRVPEFSHIDPTRIMVCASSTRGGGIHGTYAKIHPLRFENGSRTTTVRRRRGNIRYEITPVFRSGVEMLYVIYFLVPRFLNLTFREKLVTIFHELYHISPSFDGDIRRFSGKNYAHGSSRKRYNALMERLVDGYLSALDDREHLEFLQGDMAGLQTRYDAVVGRRLAAPKLREARKEPGD